MIRSLIVSNLQSKSSSHSTDSLSPEVQKKVLDAFEVFDHEQNKTVDAREIGTIIRSLGWCTNIDKYFFSKYNFQCIKIVIKLS